MASEATAKSLGIASLPDSARSNAGYLMMAFLVALLFASRTIPWATDDLVYMDNPSQALGHLNELIESGNWLFVIVEEPIYFLFSLVAGHFFQDEMYVRALIFVSSFLFFFGLRNAVRHRFFLFAVFIMVPWVCDLYFLHLREGLGVSVMLTALSYPGKWRYWLFLLAGLIHTSVLLMMPLLFYEEFAKAYLKLTDMQRILLFFLIVVGIAMLISPDYNQIISEMQTRRKYLLDESIDERNIYYILVPLGFGLVAWLFSGKTDILLSQSILGILMIGGLLFNVPWASRIYTNYTVLFAIHLCIVEYRQKWKYGLHVLYLGYAVYYGVMKYHPFLS